MAGQEMEIGERLLALKEELREIRLAMIPWRFKNADLALIDEGVAKYIKSFPFKRGCKGLFLIGGVGTGKTYSVATFAKFVIDRGNDALIKNVASFLTELKEKMVNNKDKKSYYEHLSDITHSAVLILDDIGVEKASDWVKEILYFIVNERYENGAITCFTSNYPLSELAERIGPRIVSRIRETCEVIELGGEDRRLTANN